jgi:hypothetical protein
MPIRRGYYDVNQVQDLAGTPEYLTAQNSGLIRQSQGPQFIDANVQDNSPTFRTGGNWNAAQSYGSPVLGYTDRTSQPELAATQQAALVAAKLPSNQPNNQQGANFIQGLANLFGKQTANPYIATTSQIGPDGSSILGTDGSNALSLPLDTTGIHSPKAPPMDVENLLKNQNWNMLYSMDPAKANAIYRTATGDTFDAALKKRQEQKKFITDTVQSRISNNQLRQDELGNWVEMQDAPDNSPGAMPGATKKNWVPASLQTVDMVNKAGGAEGLGLTSFKSSNPIQVAQQLRQAGWSDAGIKDYFAKNTTQSARPQVQASPQLSAQDQETSKQVKGIIPTLGKAYFGLTQSTEAERQAQLLDNSKRAQYDQFRDTLNTDPNSAIGDWFSNLKSNVFGGTVSDSPDIYSPAPTPEDLMKLRKLLPHLLNH